MTFPTKITPDHLKDTIVEFRFLINIPQELIAGYLLNVLSQFGFSYIPANTPSSPGVNISFGANQKIGIGFGSEPGLFTNENIRIQLLGDMISFNCFEDKYVGWNNYSQEIKNVITLLIENGFIRSFNRVSVRYISEFQNIEIMKNIKGAISIEETGFNLNNAILRIAEEDDNVKMFITLTNKSKRFSSKINDFYEASLVDINVFENIENISNIELLWEKLEIIHRKQKESFFKLINESFLSTLNPEY